MLGISFSPVPAAVEERRLAGDAAADYVRRRARRADRGGLLLRHGIAGETGAGPAGEGGMGVPLLNCVNSQRSTGPAQQAEILARGVVPVDCCPLTVDAVPLAQGTAFEIES